MRGTLTTKRAWRPSQFAILQERFCIRILAFKAMKPKCNRPINRKKAAHRHLDSWTKAPHSQVVSRSRPRGACPGRSKTFPNREGYLSQYQSALVGQSNGRRRWFTQSLRTLLQTATTNMSKSYFA